VGGRVCVHQEVLREPMGLESGKWGLYIHKCVVPYRSACAIEPVIRGSVLRGWNVVIFLVETKLEF
jgi:hypothetical protein